MPNRILKESICTSDNIDTLGAGAEIMFYRLIVNCDDYGRADARPRVLRSRCFPLRVDSVTDFDVIRWLTELVDAGIVVCYQCHGAPYLYLPSWDKHQQIRAKRSKFPSPEDENAQPLAPDSIGNHMQATASTCPRNPIQSNPIQSESNPIQVETNNEATQAPPSSPLTDGQRFYLEAHRRKRFANRVQAQAVADLEAEVGIRLLEDAITWAAKKGSGDLVAITTAARKMARDGGRKERANGSEALDVTESKYAHLSQ